MSAVDATTLLRPGLLDGTSLLIAGPPAPADLLAAAVGAGCAELGARVCSCLPDATDEAAVDEAVAGTLAETGSIDVLVLDGAGLFAQRLALDPDGHAALRACLDGAWNVTRAVANGAFLTVEADPARPRRIVYLAPPPDAGPRAQAARAGLENLARTLSVEWARHAIVAVTIAPGTGTPAEEVAALVAYLASPAGNYFSGCLLDLGVGDAR